ncbi:hypothetical protein CI109_103809 [Kwoniella shandongensis]|uniref:Uncharacterized protein n=1 Tax=Kwoniella shandongensis TaxID=1734106 RepID=A0A5M6C732_9TREE|nr:uncharacterized protein CI109_000497 [Kwoniella shandongensis]KAA5530926.1 hypothetical protein CI109_000497 [Kwoniella shandongensis]
MQSQFDFDRSTTPTQTPIDNSQYPTSNAGSSLFPSIPLHRFGDDGTIRDPSLLPNLSSQGPVHFAMEPSWPSQNFYNYYSTDPGRSTERLSTSPTTSTDLTASGEHSQSHRRAVTHGPNGGTFISPPPPPPHTTSHNGNNSTNLPPFSQTFYSAYHPGAANHSSSSLPASNTNHAIPHGIGYAGHMPMSAPAPNYQYPSTSPISLTEQLGSNHRAPPPHSYSESPRIPGYSSSPGLRHLSPMSPTTHLGGHGMNPSSASTSSSSFPSVSRTPANLPRGPKRRSTSASQSNESWDGDDRYLPGSGDLDHRDGDELQPWGMPQDEYKALNPRDKKQVRNRIGARRFRAKRKDYVQTLEGSLRSREDEINGLRSQLDAQRKEINDLRQRLGLPPIPQPDAGLGLVVNAAAGGAPGTTDGWSEKQERANDL